MSRQSLVISKLILKKKIFDTKKLKPKSNKVIYRTCKFKTQSLRECTQALRHNFPSTVNKNPA